jgi:hypothetical protein
MFVERCHQAEVTPQRGHRRIDIDKRDMLHAGILQDLAHRQAITAPQHQHVLGILGKRQSRMNERFVVTVLVNGVELQIPVQKQLKAFRGAGDHDPLVRRTLRIHDGVGVDLLLGQVRQPIGGGDSHAQ